MELVSVEICNFRQFYGVNKVVFSRSSERNITLIHAENGVGKTAFLNAILWCLFEEVTENFEHPGSLLNYAKEAEGDKGYYVFVEFEHEGRRYIAQRQLANISNSVLVFRVFEILPSGNSSPVENPAYFINTVIPKEMARYFFFQGEGAGNFANNKRGRVKEAIRSILGFTLAEIALEDIKKIKSEFRKDLKRIDKTSELAKIQDRLAEAEGNVTTLEAQLTVQKGEESYLTDEVARVEQEYRESNVEVLRGKQALRDSKKAELDRANGHLSAAYRRKAALISNYATSVFSKKIADEGIDFIDDRELKGQIPAPFNVQLVKDILEQASCICGAAIHPGTEAFSNIQDLLGKASDPVLMNRITRARGQLTGIKKDLKSAEQEFSSVQNDLSAAIQSVETITRELAELSAAIKGINLDGIAEKERELEKLVRELKESSKAVGSFETRLSVEKRNVDKLKADSNRFSAMTPEISSFSKRIEFVENLENRLQETLEQAEISSRDNLLAKINEFLGLYVRQDYKVRMNSNYDINLYDRNENRVPKSDGQALLVSLTFISALISIAKEREGASGDILLPGASAPFVIDAPFGVLDNDYKANIAREIPKSVTQVVFLLSSSHWEGAVESVIRERIGAEYNMVLEVASEAKESVNTRLEINGSSYETVIYNAERDATKIVEVARYD